MTSHTSSSFNDDLIPAELMQTHNFVHTILNMLQSLNNSPLLLPFYILTKLHLHLQVTPHITSYHVPPNGWRTPSYLTLTPNANPNPNGWRTLL